MTIPIILASGSEIRRKLLSQAGVPHESIVARIDEDAIKNALLAERAPARDIADTLAEMKARKVSDKHPDALVLGCDQVLSFNGTLLSKPKDKKDLKDQLKALCGASHELLSAVVIYESGKPVWRTVGRVTMTMQTKSEAYLDEYIERNWDSVRHAVGGYKLEEEGVRLFTEVKGDYFTVLGIPLLEVLVYLGLRGVLDQ